MKTTPDTDAPLDPLPPLPATGLTSPRADEVRAYHTDRKEADRAQREEELDQIKADLAPIAALAKAIGLEVMALVSEHGSFLEALHQLVEQEFFLRTGPPHITSALQRETREVYDLIQCLQGGDLVAVPRRIENLTLQGVKDREHIVLRKIVESSAAGPFHARRVLKYIVETLWPIYKGLKPDPLTSRNAVAAAEVEQEAPHV